MNILIAGAAGFIGSNLVSHLLQNTTHKIVSVDDLSGTPDLDNLHPAMAHRRHTFYLADVCSDIMNKLIEIEKLDLVIDLTRNVTNSQKLMVGDAQKISRNLARLCKKAGIKNHLSMSECPEPISDAGRTDISLCNIFGLRQSPREVVPSIIKNALSGTETNVQHDITPKEWMYIGDLVEIMTNIINSKVLPEAITIGSGQFNSDLEIAELATNIVNDNEYKLETLFAKTIGLDQAVDFGYPKIRPLQDAIAHTLQWYSLNTWAFKDEEV